MGVCGAVFGRRGDAGFSGALLGVSRGVVGFNVAMFLRPVRVICCPVSSIPVGVCEKVRPARPIWVLGVLGELFRGDAAGGAVPGELFRAVGLGG